MEQISKGAGIITNLAEIADKAQKTLTGKATIIFELKESEFNSVVATLNGTISTDDRFKIEISGTEFIFLKDE